VVFGPRFRTDARRMEPDVAARLTLDPVHGDLH
jgi:hypothetical protein